MLLIVATFVLKKYKDTIILFTKSWSTIIIASLSLALGIFTWYDSINRIGASKEALIAGPIEIIIIIILARIFLKERLNRFHFIGIGLASIGFILSLASDLHIGISNNIFELNTNIASITAETPPSFLSILSFGDIEAIISAIGFAICVLFLGKLVLRHSSIQVAGASMFIAGLFLSFVMLLAISYNSELLDTHQSSSTKVQSTTSLISTNVIILLLFSLIPFIGSLSYSIGLRRIGASLTATIGSSNLIITLIMQIILKESGFPSHLPENILLAIMGSIIGFFGIFIIHIPDYFRYKTIRK